MKTKKGIHSLIFIISVGFALRYTIAMEPGSDTTKKANSVGSFRKTKYINQLGDTRYKVERFTNTSNQQSAYWDVVGFVDDSLQAESLIGSRKILVTTK